MQVLEEGREQLAAPLSMQCHQEVSTTYRGAMYMDTLGCSEGWLIVFDRRKTVTWEEKIFWRTAHDEGKTMHLVGC